MARPRHARRHGLPETTPSPAQRRDGDVAGRQVAVIVDKVQAKGPHEVRWNGTDSRGQSLSAGVYFLRLGAGEQTRMSKITLIK